ncbi:MAG TPA: TIGR04255 family protein [Polyangia bacterium]|nr:TIGR04255 family protein [Polyangia bacterium]
MTQVMPAKLRKSPLLEALFEVRFVPVVEGAGDVLPGLIFGSLRSKYARVEPLPAAGVPRNIRAAQEALIYQASHRLHGSDGSSIQVGDRVAAVSTTSYPGWEAFRSLILELVSVLRETGLVRTVERFSFRYINLLTSSADAKQLPLLNLHVELVGRSPDERGFLLRTEFDSSDITSVVQIAPNASAKGPNNIEVSGLLVDIDTVLKTPGSTFFTEPTADLEKVHRVVKETFFSLLTKETLAELGPE